MTIETAPSLIALVLDRNWSALLVELGHEAAKDQALAFRDVRLSLLVLARRLTCVHQHKLWGLLHFAVSKDPPVEVVAKLLEMGFGVNENESVSLRTGFKMFSADLVTCSQSHDFLFVVRCQDE